MEEKSMRFRWVSQTLGLITPLSAIIGLYIGGWFMGITIVYLLGLSMILDLILGVDNLDNPNQEGVMHDLIIHAHALLVPILTLYLVYTLSLIHI